VVARIVPSTSVAERKRRGGFCGSLMGRAGQ
jgi:hypothetical protein